MVKIFVGDDFREVWRNKNHLPQYISASSFFACVAIVEMILEPEVFDSIHGDELFEYAFMNRLVEDKQILGFIHKGYWQCMDALREKQQIEKL